MKLYLKVILIFLVSISTFSLSAQDESSDTTASNYSSKKPYYITLKDGSSYSGFIIKDDAREILLKTTSVGEIYIPKVSIKSISEIDKVGKMKQGKYFGEETYYTRYLFSPNAFSLNKGEGNAYLPYGTYIQSQFGVSDNIDVGIGTSWLGNPLTLTVKYSMELREDLNFAIGGLGITTTYSLGGYFGGGLGFGVLTKGNPSSNLSLGGGYGILYSNGLTSQGYALTGGAYHRLATRWAVMMDGLYMPEFKTYIAGPGVRYYRQRKEGEIIDFGIMLVGNQFVNSAAPFFGFPIISYIITL